MKRRVVVTGMGVLSPVGTTLADAWSTILAGKSATISLNGELFKKLPSRVAAIITKKDGAKFELGEHFPKSQLRSLGPASAYALLAAHEAMLDAQLADSIPEELRLKTGVAVGMGMVDLQDVSETDRSFAKSYNQVSPFFIPRILLNMAAGQISIKYGLRGPNHSVSTACATGAHAIGDAFRFILTGDADVMVCGGAEASVSPLAMAAFCRLRALSTNFNDRPEQASRPFDKSRDGFVMGEGSAILVLEELQHAKARNAHIYAEILGYGLSGDASHLTAPSPDGAGAILAMKRALADANVNPTEIGYINAHATSTPIGDAIETKAIKTVFGNDMSNLAISSTKGAHGHLLGAAGNLEAVFAIKAVQEGSLPPTINFEQADDMDVNFVPNVSQKWPGSKLGRRIALKNAFGFGGTNACLCISEYVKN